ncbi:MAG: hypothetical protein C0436_04290 [Alphaproteobacteria bacterium]|nr:hypothetical protein [Alphaproteobacteria bacterium]
MVVTRKGGFRAALFFYEKEVYGLGMKRFVGIALCACGVMAMDKYPDVHAPVAVVHAVAEVKRRGLQPDNYRTQVVQDAQKVIVVFIDKRLPEEGRPVRSPNYAPGLEVELNASDLSVIRSYYIR